MLVFVACWAGLLAAPTLASACSAGARADVRAAMRLVASLRAAGAPGAPDAAAVLSRARRSCADARFARAVAAATSRRGLPQVGQRTRAFGYDLVGRPVDGGAAWRLDVVRLSARLATSRSESSAAVLRAQLRSAGFGRAAISWSADATRFGWDAQLQSAVAVTLARSPRLVDRRLAGASARGFAPPARQAALTRLPVLEHLRIANRVARAATSSPLPAARTTARAVAVRAFVRVRAAHARGWSRIDGSWSTLPAHRMLVGQASALLARVPHAATATHVRALQETLTSPTDVSFGTLPSGEFYPWPRDAAFDTQAVSVDVDKPGTVTLTVYAPDGRAVRTLQSQLEPGPATFAWDGTATDGSTLAPGDYRYNLDAADLAGNRVRVPGLDQFRIARDTKPPAVRSTSVRHLLAGGTRRIVASWDVEEVHSPEVHSWLLLQEGERRVSLDLHGSLRTATVRRIVTLERGSWRATFVFSDGSGNRTSQAAGIVVVR